MERLKGPAEREVSSVITLQSKVMKQTTLALTPGTIWQLFCIHFIRGKKKKLTNEEDGTGMKWAHEMYPSTVPLIMMAYRVELSPFQPYYVF